MADGRSPSRRPRRATRAGTARASSPRAPSLTAGEPASPERLRFFADAYGLVLPEAWRRWCEERGWLAQPAAGWELLGLRPAPSGMDSAALLAGMRLSLRKVPGGFPADLVPVEWLPERQLACLRLDGSTDPPVVIIDLEDPATWTTAQRAANSFSEFAEDFMAQARAYAGVTGFLQHRQREVESGIRAAGQVPRPDDWRAYRFCSQNVVIAMMVLRHNRDDNVLEIGACLITALSRLDPDAPARAACTVLLAEAYRAGGDLSLRFVQGTKPTAGPVPIPWPVMRWARRCGVNLNRVSGQVPADAARLLFTESIRVDERLRRRLRAEDLRRSVPAICYGIASGQWDPAEVEVMLAWSARPGWLLHGGSDPLDRASYAGDLLDVRAAMLVAALVRRLSAGNGDPQYDAEDSGLPVEVVAEDDQTCLLRAASVDVPDWCVGSRSPQGGSLRLAVADAEPDQLPGAVGTALGRLRGYAAEACAVLCPRDLLAASERLRQSLAEQARSAGAVLLAAPDYTPGLTIRAADKLSRARTARQ
jgi:hypothetical protein